ncbi:MAG: hypothetical protein HPKKFMNG_02303 [Planctomycetes bacterium]|nr:hypothetical protein [Planctomycetota bacterium]
MTPKKVACLACVLALSLLAGCAEFKDYQYRDYQVSRENAYHTMKAVLANEGYTVVIVEDQDYKEPEIYLETDWNMRNANQSVYRGNSIRRKAYVRILTRYTERGESEFQPLDRADKPMTKEERAKWEKEHEAAAKKGDLEFTTIGIAVRRERLSDVKSPADIINGDWVYEGPDSLAADIMFGDLEMILADKKGAGEPTRRSMEREKSRMGGGAGK